MPKIVDQDARRAEVLAATWRTIARLGISGTTMREIAKEAGVSTGFINHYFADKGEVLRAALRRSRDQIERAMADRTKSATGLAALRALIEETLPLDDERRLGWLVWFNFLGNAVGDPALVEEQQASYRTWKTEILERLREAQVAGEIPREADAAYEADRLIALVAGIGAQAVILRGRWRTRRALAFVDDHIASLASGRVADVGRTPASARRRQ